MLIFMDMIVTDRGPRPKLISLALVSIDGPELYLESAQVDRSECGRVLQEKALTQLGRIAGSACKPQEIPGRLRQWIKDLPEPATIVCEDERDWDRVVQLALTGSDEGKPRSLSQAWVLGDEITESPAYREGTLAAYMGDDGLDYRHALADARARRTGFRRWAGMGTCAAAR